MKSSNFGNKLPYLVISLMALIVIIFGCGGKDDPTGPGHETTPPSLLYTSPVDEAINVPINSVIRATFSEPIDSESVSSETFSVNNGVTGSFSFNGNSVILTPSAPLTYSTVYQATYTTGLTDSVGNHIADGYTWSFTAEPDPATTFPTVVSTYPTNNATNVPGDAAISVTFSKGMDEATLDNASFLLNNGATGVITCDGSTATFTPDDTLEYDMEYMAIITTAVADTFGNHLQSQYDWTFTTEIDPYIPVLSITNPFDEAIVGDNMTISVNVTHPVGVDKVEFYIDDIHIPQADDISAPYGYDWDATGWSIGSVHSVSAMAYDGYGHVGASDTLDVIYQWEVMKTDDNSEDLLQDVRRMLARSTNSTLELRYEYAQNWTYPYPVEASQFNDYSIDLGIYLDSDVNPATGRPDFAGLALNGIGADHRIIIGLHGGDTALAYWNEAADPDKWDIVFDTTGFAYHNVPMDTNVFEIGIDWSDLGSTYGANIVNIHVYFIDTLGNFETDWVPDRGDGFVSVAKSNRYIGEGYSPGKIKAIAPARHIPPVIRFNPFNANAE